MGFQFGDAICVRLDGFGGHVGHRDEILIGHLGVAEDLAAVLASDGKSVIRARPRESVLVDVWHRCLGVGNDYCEAVGSVAALARSKTVIAGPATTATAAWPPPISSAIVSAVSCGCAIEATAATGASTFPIRK